MRLLSKSEIVANKAAERKMEVDEGAKLARKVDTLRETVSKEGENLAKFRIESLKRIKEELNSLFSEKTALENEIKDLAAERLRLQKPLDDEWKFVHEKEEMLQKQFDSIKEKLIEWQKKDKEIFEREEKVIIREQRAKSDDERVEKALEEARETLENANELFSDADSKRKITDDHVEEVQSQLVSRETRVAAREREADIKEKYLYDRNIELLKKEQFINDKYQTLLRTQKHVGQRIKRSK